MKFDLTMKAQKPMNHWVEYFNIPLYQWFYIISIFVFFSLFMLFFQPFGVTNYDPQFSFNVDFFVIIMVFSLVLLVVLVANEFILRPVIFKEITENNILIWILWTYLLLGTTTFLHYNYNGEWHDFIWSSYFEFIVDIGAVISFPIIGFIFYLRHEFLKHDFRKLKLTQPTSETGKMVSLWSDSPKEVFSVQFDDLLYLKSDNNYVSVFYTVNQSVKEQLIRTSLKQLEKELDNPLLIRCHRSYIINLSKVVSCKNDGHALLLFLTDLESPLRVSRSYKDTVLSIFEQSGT